MNKRSPLAIGSWAAIAFGLWLSAWIIAESIPNFNDLLAFMSALFGSWFTYGIAGVFWLFMNKGQWIVNWRKTCLCVANWGLILMSAVICFVGLYTSGDAMAKGSSKGGSWTCKNNAE